MTKFTNRTLWGRFGKYLSLPGEPDEGSESLINFICRIVSDLLVRPINFDMSLCAKYDRKVLDEKISSIFQDTSLDIDLCHKKTLDMAVQLTRIPFSAITHAVINRLKVGKSNNKFVHETTLELVQHISIALVNVSPNHKLYMGDCHTCILYCEKCNQKFGLPGSIIKVLAEASNTILYHYGLELGELDESDEYENMNQQRFMNSLPLHTMQHLMGTFSTSIVKRLSTMNNQRFKYGTGNVLSRYKEDKNNYYLHAWHEAMKIDTYFAGNDFILKQRANHMSCLVLSLFDVAHH